MFGKKKYKYFISFWYQLGEKETKFRDAYIEINKKINVREHIPNIRLKLKEEVENETGKHCNCVSIINWKKMK